MTHSLHPVHTAFHCVLILTVFWPFSDFSFNDLWGILHTFAADSRLATHEL